MNDCMERSKQRMFVREIETVSIILAGWVQDRFEAGWSIDDVKIAIRNAAKICGRDL